MTWAVMLAVGLFTGILAFQHIGHRIAMKRIALDPEGAKKGAGVVEGAIFGLLSLLIAFTFSGALSRFDARRHFISDEALHTGTAWQRIDVLPLSVQPAMRDLFRRYLDSRLEMFRRPEGSNAAEEEWARTKKLQNEIWAQGVVATQASTSTVPGMLFLPAVNQMIDITGTRRMATRMHPPSIVFGMLSVLALIAGLLSGYHMAGGKARSLLHAIGFALVISATVYVIFDIEYPRQGLIRVDGADALLQELRRDMNANP
jgi:hypothetical protein